MKRAICAGFLLMLTALAAMAQVPSDEKCSGRIYGSGEVTKRARILERPDLNINARGVIVINAVLCRSGRVTDIQVVKGLSPSIDEFFAAAVSMVKFVPAEFRWHSVSQRMMFEFSFGGNAPGIKVDTSADATGGLVEAVTIMGNRRLTSDQVLSWIRSQPGEPFRPEQVGRDLEAILATGQFDKDQTSVTIEDGIRGGLVITFEVMELSLIKEIKFEGLKIDPKVVFAAWKTERVQLKSGDVYNADTVQAAARVIKQVLDKNGRTNSRVETVTESPTAMTVNVIFVITENR
ncbi:MAG TPA: POTRA domain-containing protein [Pyrinomonadaceae bacterium]|nr:POTRA domain-containing protein [Pyrinomonadaceae bacterium]